MENAKDLIMTMKSKNKSNVGYSLRPEFETLIGNILQNMAKSPLPELKIDKKNEKDSIRYREEGNQYFVAGDDIEAIESYTKSLAYATTNELRAYAHANRSAALYRQKMFRECLIDIKAALGLDYPEEKRQKLEERGMKAIGGMNKSLNAHLSSTTQQNDCPFGENNVSANKKFPLISQLSEETLKKNDEKDFNTITAEIEKMSIENSNLSASGNFIMKPRYLQNPEVMTVPYGPSKEAPANSDGIKISFSEEHGRHLVASREFKPGDILTIEEPYSWVIYRDKFYTHCHYCLERCFNLTPCSECPIAQYCSEKCKNLAWELSHQFECPVLGVLVNLLNMDEDKVRMVMKIVRLLVTVTSNGRKIKELQDDMEIAEANEDDRTSGFTDEGILDSNSARSALGLATNTTVRPLMGVSAFACISALTAMLLSTQTKFFGKIFQLEELRNLDQHQDIKFCGSLMLRACLITATNTFSIQPEPGIKSGSGLYVVHSLYNHSCAPNTFRHFEGLTMITRAMEPIHPGQEIFTGYGADHAYMSRDKRKAKLMEEYFFDCQCVACINDWPTYQDILQNHIGSITKNKQLVERLKPYKQRLLQNMYDIEAVKEVLCILHDHVEKPCEEILHGVQYLRSYYLDP